jgi:hypothetical protein
MKEGLNDSPLGKKGQHDVDTLLRVYAPIGSCIGFCNPIDGFRSLHLCGGYNELNILKSDDPHENIFDAKGK